MNLKLVKKEQFIELLSDLPKQSVFVVCLTQETEALLTEKEINNSIYLYKSFVQLNHLMKENKEIDEEIFEDFKSTLHWVSPSIETILVEWPETLEGRGLAIMWALCHYFNLNDEWIWELGYCPNRKLLGLFNQHWQIGWDQVEFNQRYNSLNFNLMYPEFKSNPCFKKSCLI